MEPQVQYVQAKDGTSIAYAVYDGGPGVPIVKLATAVGSRRCGHPGGAGGRAGDGGQVVVTDVVRQLVTGQQFVFADRGIGEIKGFPEPMRTWELMW